MTPFQLRLSKARFWDGQSPLLTPDHRFLFSTQSRASEPAIEFPLLLKSQAFPRLLFSVDCPSRLSFQLRVRPRIELPLFSFVPNSSAVLLRVSRFRYFLFSLCLTLPRAHRWASPISLPDRPPSWTSPGAALAPVSAVAPAIGRFDATASAPLARFVCPAEAPSPWPMLGGVASLALPDQTACFCLWKDAECARKGP